MTRVWTVLAAALAAMPIASGPARPAVAAEPQPGVLSRLSDTIPNYFFAPGHTPADWTPDARSHLTVAADPVRGRYFEFAQAACRPTFPRNAAVYDLATYKVVGTGCVMNLLPGTIARSGATLRYTVRTNAGGRASIVAVDPTDGVIFLIAGVSGAGTSVTDSAATQAVPHQIAVFSEDTLELLDVWDMPAGTTHIGGLSWYAQTDELLVTTDWADAGGMHPGGAVSVSSFDVSGTLKRAKGAPTPPLWTHPVTSCFSGVQPDSAPVEAHRSSLRPVLYVPCNVGWSGHLDDGFATTYRSGVVAVPIGAGAGCPTGRQCPTSGIEQVAVAPTDFGGFVFDPGSDRAFAPNNKGATGVSLLVYDGASNAFVSRTSIGTATDRNGSSIGLDPRTGRLYATGFAALTLLDGRRSPMGTGLVDRRFQGYTYGTDLAAISPDRKHPYTRVVVPYFECGSTTLNCALPSITVLADRIPVTVNPPLSDRDAGTYNGPIGGRATSITYSADASGYGAHVVWVGSAGAVMNNENGGNNSTGLALAEGDRDLLAGYVRKVSLGEESAAAAASPLGDGNGSTSQAVTDDPPNVPHVADHGWPYPTVACGYPGVVGHAATTDPSQTATADVVCDKQTGGPDARARFGGRATTTGGPTVTVASAETVAHVHPPTQAHGVTSTVTATVAGLVIDLGANVGRIEIGRLSQTATATATGRKGGAKATWPAPELSDVVVRTASGPPVVLCERLCPQYDAVVERLNATFPAYLRILRPKPEVTASPGGYEAAVQSNADAVNGDVQFNHMPSEEAALVPALRVVVYNDGNALSRVVTDLAGVRADAHQGVQVLSDPTVATPPSTTPSHTDPNAGRDYAIPPLRGGFKTESHPTPYALPRTVGNPIAAAVIRAFEGFAFLLRRPGELLSVLALLGLLLGPLLLMARRRLWTRDVFAG